MKNTFYSEVDFTCLEKPRTEDYRSPFEKDRDRLIHTSAFRRLQAKTQVFFSGEYDFYRSRLTHSIEVAQIGRSIVSFLNHQHEKELGAGFIDSALVEAICLSHDLGHPPFGHAGEKSLHQLMKTYGGFEGNAQSLRLLTKTIYVQGDHRVGMNPTRAFLDGILKYKAILSEYSEFPDNHFIYNEQKYIRDFVWNHWFPETVLNPEKDINKIKSIECQIMDWADDTAYSINDIIDGFQAGFISPSAISQWKEKQSIDAEKNKIVDDLIGSLTSQDYHALLARKIGSFIQATRLQKQDHPLAKFSNRYQYQLVIAPEAIMMSKLYKKISVDLVFKTPQLQQFEYKGNFILSKLFSAFMEEAISKGSFRLLPIELKKRIDAEYETSEKARWVCDYLAGMTDRFAIRTYKRLFDPDFGSIVDLV